LNRTKDSLDKHHQDGHMSAFQVEKLQNQVENFRKDNLLLRAEITDARNQLIKRDNTIKELHLELNDPIRNKNGMNSMSMRLSMTNDALTKESLTSQKVFLQ
jgi:recombination DNA repair RAD52 pathway protein